MKAINVTEEINITEEINVSEIKFMKSFNAT